MRKMTLGKYYTWCNFALYYTWTLGITLPVLSVITLPTLRSINLPTLSGTILGTALDYFA